jgi:hypothetical protein
MKALLATVALIVLPVAPASAQTKEGTTSGTYYGHGTAKVTAVGTERLLITFEDIGPSVGEGIIDHLTNRCWGIGDFTNGMGKSHGYCLAIDPAGDQIVTDWSENENHALNAREVAGSFTYTTGTGKFAGITGSGTYIDRGNTFKPLTEGTYEVQASSQASYKLPAASN